MQNPIGMIINGGSTAKGPTYNFVDLRDGELLFSSELAAKEAAPIVAELNERNRHGAYEEDFDLIRKHAATLCAGEVVADNTPVLEATVVAAPTSGEGSENTTDTSAKLPSWTPPRLMVPTLH